MLEHQPLPSKVTERVGSNGPPEELSRDQDEEIVRENQVTVYMSVATLLSFHRWLGQKINEIEKAGIIKKAERE